MVLVWAQNHSKKSLLCTRPVYNKSFFNKRTKWAFLNCWRLFSILHSDAQQAVLATLIDWLRPDHPLKLIGANNDLLILPQQDIDHGTINVAKCYVGNRWWHNLWLTRLCFHHLNTFATGYMRALSFRDELIQMLHLSYQSTDELTSGS